MDIDSAMAAIEEADGILTGPFRAPANLAADSAGSIHDDKTAQGLGFRGGTVAGSVHMQQFPPMLVRMFGPEWFEHGTISTYFRNATMHGERVRPFGRVPAARTDALTTIWMEREDGSSVLEGTASIGTPNVPTCIEERLQAVPDRGETRILAHVEPGIVTDAVPARMPDPVRLERQIAAMTEPLDWYDGPSPWGGPIMNPGAAVGMFRAPEALFNLNREGIVGLFGAIEIRHLNGPILRDHQYDCRGELLAVGSTPKSEYIWYRSTLDEGGTDIAQMIMMLRFMKASSAHWSN
ncbi:MAG: hypothetical protein KC458_03160 [Dehalococcoidia bacterium]|nr:hypothetical protein [Dehalococcoidia bacterium]